MLFTVLVTQTWLIFRWKTPALIVNVSNDHYKTWCSLSGSKICSEICSVGKRQEGNFRLVIQTRKYTTCNSHVFFQLLAYIILMKKLFANHATLKYLCIRLLNAHHKSIIELSKSDSREMTRRHSFHCTSSTVLGKRTSWMFSSLSVF